MAPGSVVGLRNTWFFTNRFLTIPWEVNKLKTNSIAKRVTIAILALIFLLTFVSVAPALAMEKPQGEMNLEFNLDWFVIGPQTFVPDWVGTITIDDKEYGMLFFAFGSGMPFVTPPYKGGHIHFFEEIWAIYDNGGDFEITLPNGNFDDWAQWLPENNPETLVLRGYDRGITNILNSKYHMSGYVEEAFEEFAGWEGRNVFMSGIIIWYPNGAPNLAPGTFRIN